MEVIPFRSVGVLSFGDEREIARQKLGSIFHTFRKGVSGPEADSFDTLGLHLYYDDSGRLEFIEAFAPADVTFRDIRFLGRDVETVIAEMKAIGFESTDSDVGVDFPDAGLALTAPEGVVEGIAAHREGYYD